MIAQIHREPAHIDREHWRFEHVTTPRDSWLADDNRRVRRLVERLLIGDECDLPDGRRITRDSMRDYTIWRNPVMVETRLKSKSAAVHYLTGYAAPMSEPTTPPSRKSKYHNVYYISRECAWRAELMVNQKHIYIGWSKSEEAAARMYDDYVRKHGLNRPLNFPQQEAA